MGLYFFKTTNMIDPKTLAIGNKYRNIKTGDVYEVVLLSRHSEDSSEFLVSYQKEGDDFPWSRPLVLFTSKFEEV